MPRPRLGLASSRSGCEYTNNLSKVKAVGAPVVGVAGPVWTTPCRLGLQTAPGTGPRVEPQDAPQEGCQVASAEALPIAQRVDFPVAVAFGTPISDRDALDVAPRFAPDTGLRTTFRIAPGTVPGTVPTVVRRMSIWTTLIGSNAASFRYLGQFGLV